LRLFSATLLILLLTGCTASGPQFHETRFAAEPVPTDKARIIFLRHDENPMSEPVARLEIDGARIGELKNRGFRVVDAPAGERAIAVDSRAESGKLVLKLTVSAQHVHYLRVSRREEHYRHQMLPLFFGLAGAVAASTLSDDKGPFKIEPIEQAEATKLLSELRLSE